MDKNIIIVSCLLAFALILGGCTQNTGPTVVQQPVEQPQQNVTNSTVAASPCSTGNIVQKDGCFLALAQSTNNPETCKNIYSIDTLDSCYALFASTNLEVCKEITNSDMRAGCLAQIAISQKSEDVCNLIENDQKRGDCLVKVLPPCMAVMDPGARALCLALQNNNSGLCNNDDCLAAYAKNKSDTNACTQISVQTDRYVCMAVVENSVSACMAAQLTPIQNACVEKASELLDMPSGCDLAAAQTDYSNRCYLYFAVKNLDPAICTKAAPEEMRDECYSNYSIMTANVSTCSKILETLNKLGCYYHAASVNRMPSLCNPLSIIIGTGSQRSDCYSLSMLTDKGPVPSDCALVDSTDWKDKCYYTAARVAYNSTLCGFINPGDDRDSCDALFN